MTTIYLGFNDVINKSGNLRTFEDKRFYVGLEFNEEFLRLVRQSPDCYRFKVLGVGKSDALKNEKEWFEKKIEGYDILFTKKMFKDGSIPICMCRGNTLYGDFIMVNTWDDVRSVLDFYKEYDVKTLKKRG